MSKITDLLQNLFFIVLKDEIADVKPAAEAYLDSITKNPSAENVVAQSILFQQQVIAALPNMQADAARDVAIALKAFLDAQLPSLIASLPTGATAAPPTA